MTDQADQLRARINAIAEYVDRIDPPAPAPEVLAEMGAAERAVLSERRVICHELRELLGIATRDRHG